MAHITLWATKFFVAHTESYNVAFVFRRPNFGLRLSDVENIFAAPYLGRRKCMIGRRYCPWPKLLFLVVTSLNNTKNEFFSPYYTASRKANCKDNESSNNFAKTLNNHTHKVLGFLSMKAHKFRTQKNLCSQAREFCLPKQNNFSFHK